MDFSSLKRLSVRQEKFIAREYDGAVSPSSGGAETDEGDVLAGSWLMECKFTGSPTKPAKSIPIKLSDFEKIADEARSVGKLPAMAMRIYNPDSVLADKDGFVDFVVRLVNDDYGYLA